PRCLREEASFVPMVPASDFGALLRHYRRAAGLTQEQLAERAEIAVHTVSALERGVHQAPHDGTIEQLAEALKLSPEERARFETAARRRLATEQAPPDDMPLPLTPASADQTESPDQPASASLQQPAPLPARPQRKRVVLGLGVLLVLVVASSGLV